MIHYASTPRTPHLFPIGHMRTINGERCILIRYTQGRNPRPQYRRPDGTTVTVRPAAKWRGRA